MTDPIEISGFKVESLEGFQPETYNGKVQPYDHLNHGREATSLTFLRHSDRSAVRVTVEDMTNEYAANYDWQP